MKQWIIIVGLLLFLFIAGCLVVFRTIIPTTAQAFVPLRWQTIPLGQHVTMVHEYLGTPDTVLQGPTDQWHEEINSMKKYLLNVKYNNDTLVYYKITYQVTIFGMEDITDVKSDSLR